MPGVSLNEEGKEQANKLAERLKHLPIAAIYTSPLERAVETAQPLSIALNTEVIIDDGFIEMDFGDWTNSTISDLEENPDFKLFNTFRSNKRIPGGDLMPEAQTRFISAMQKLYAKHPGKIVAIVSHADMIKAAVTYYAGIHLDLFQRIEISPASVSIIEVYDETARIVLVNDTGSINV
jgi:probable phosphoglycerate mutase